MIRYAWDGAARMIRRIRRFAALFIALATAVPANGAPAKAVQEPPPQPVDARTAGAESVLSFGRFGAVAIYRQTPHPSHVVLFVSGDGGWNLGVVDMAKTLAKHGRPGGRHRPPPLPQAALAAAKESCSYAGERRRAAEQVRAEEARASPTYAPPVLVGYSSGATLVYALLVAGAAEHLQRRDQHGLLPRPAAAQAVLRRPWADLGARAEGQGVQLQAGRHSRAALGRFPGDWPIRSARRRTSRPTCAR